MSLESEISRLATAVEENNALLKKAMGAKAEAAAPKADKPATPKADKPKADKPAASKKSEVPTFEEIREAFGTYMAEAKTDPDLKKERRDQVKAISSHFGVELVSQVEPEQRKAALAYLEQFKNGETPDFMNEEETERDEEEVV